MSTGKGLTRAEFLKMTAGAAAAGASWAVLGQTPSRAETNLLRRPIPKSGEMLPVIGLGTAQTFGQAPDAAAYASRKGVVKALLDGGAALIDTSPTYRGAEAVVGRALAELGARPKAFLATKISTRGEAEGAVQSRQSFADLKTGKIDLLQVHNLRDTKLHLQTIRGLKDQGKVRYVGVTHFRPNAYEALARVLRTEPLDFVQFAYSLDLRDAEKTLLPLARDKGVAVLLNLPLGRGRLFRKVRGKALPSWAAEFGAKSWGQFFLKFVLANEAVTVALPGTTKPVHMIDNLGAARGPLPTPAHLKRMIRFIESV